MAKSGGSTRGAAGRTGGPKGGRPPAGPGSRGGKKSRRDRPVAAKTGPSPLMIAGVVIVLLFAGAVGFGIYKAQQQTGAVPAGAGTTGVTVGQASAPATVDVYLDFQCPVCRQYEQLVGPTVDQMVSAGTAKVVYHPLGFLDRFSTTQYSSRAAAASGCASAAGVFPQYLKLLYANQPTEGSAGLPNEQLVALGQQAGAKGDFAACVAGGNYAGWVKKVTEEASKAGVNATPTVMVNGKQIENTPDALRQAVEGAK